METDKRSGSTANSRPSTVRGAFVRRRAAQRGMTLVEIMVVMAILGLIMAAVGVAVIPRMAEARRDRAYLDMKNIESALKQYHTRKGKFPDTGGGLKTLVDEQYFEEMPKDPWGNDYQYMLQGGKPVISSYGGDGAPGGEGGDADLTSKDSKDTKK
jgi:general secretion pathway protein G